MADNERDARLILRAEDRATKTFEQVSRSVKDLTKTLAEQAKAAQSGEGSLDALTATLKELQRAGDDLVRQQGAIKAFEKTGDAAEKAQARLDKATKAYQDYQAALANSKGTEAGLGRKAASVDSAQAALDKQNAKVDEARTKLTALGLAADDAAQQYDTIGLAAREVAQGIAAANNAISGFATNQEKAAAAARELAVAEAEAASAIERESNVAEKSAAQRRAALLDSARDILAGNEQVNASFAELNREIDADRIRKYAQESEAASTNLNRFAQTGEATAIGLTRLGDAIRGIVAPTLSTVQSLDGALEQVEQSATLAASEQKKRISQYQDSLNALKQAQGALVRQGENADAFNKQRVAVDLLDAKLGRAAQRVEDFASALALADAPTEQERRELEQLNKELERTGNEALDARRKFEQMGDGLRRAGVDTDNLDKELLRLETGARKSAVVADTLTAKVGGNGKGFLGLKSYELTNLGYQINDVFTSLASGISPVQTLAQQGPQIAQLFPRILLGALRLLPVLAPLAVGFGAIAYNILQARKEAAAIEGFDKTFTLAANGADYSAAQFGRAQIALERLKVSASDAQAALRTFVNAGLDTGQLDNFLNTVRQISAATGEDFPSAASKYAAALSGGYEQVVALNDITHTLTDTQLAEIQSLFDAGKAQEARTAVAEAYRAKAQEIADKSQSEWKRAVEAFAASFERLNNAFSLSEGASAIARRAIGEVIAVIDRFRSGVDAAQGAYNRLLNIKARGEAAILTGGGLAGNFDEKLKERRRLLGLSDTGEFQTTVSAKVRLPGQTGKSGDTTAGGQAFIRQQQVQLRNAKLLTAEQRLQNAEQVAANAAASANANDAEIATAKLNARKLEQAKLDKEAEQRAKAASAASTKAANKAAREAREVEARQTKINNLTRDLENTYNSLSANKQDDPFKAIQVKAANAINDIQAKFAQLAKLGVTTVAGKTEAQFEAQVKAAAALETQQAQQKKNEQDVNDLLSIRKTKLDAIEQQVGRGELTPLQGIQQASVVAEDLDSQIAAAAQNALDFATSIRGAVPDPKLEAFIEQTRTTLAEASGRTNLVDIGLQGLQQAQQQLDALVARRNAVAQAQNTLVQLDAQTTSGAQAIIKKAYEDSQPAILAQVDAVQQIINKLLVLPGLSDEVRLRLQSIATGLPVVRQETKALDADMVALRAAAEQALSGSIADFITSIGENVAAAIDGSKSLGDVLSSLGQSALSFAASFTAAIAQAITQLIALKIAKAALSAVGLGTFHSGGVVGSAQSGSRRKVSPLAFAAAPRYHTGGIVGLRPDEQAAILKDGEEVLTETDPRHRNNVGRSVAPTPITLKNINLFDAGEAVSQGANTAPGERAIINVLGRNPTAARQALGLDG